jgi:hypothetical protein
MNGETENPELLELEELIHDDCTMHPALTLEQVIARLPEPERSRAQALAAEALSGDE